MKITLIENHQQKYNRYQNLRTMVRKAMKNPRIIYIPYDRTDGGGFIYTIGKRGELQTETEFHNANEMDAILKNLASAKPIEKPKKKFLPTIPKIKEAKLSKNPIIFDRNILTSFVQDTIDGANLRTKVDFISPSHEIINTDLFILLPIKEKSCNYIQRLPSEPEPNQSGDRFSLSDVSLLLHPQRAIDTNADFISLIPNKEKSHGFIQKVSRTLSEPEPHQNSDMFSSGVNITSQLVLQ